MEAWIYRILLLLGGLILLLGYQVVNCDGFVAVWAEAACAFSGAGSLAVRAPLLAEVALLAVAAAVDGDVPASSGPAVKGGGERDDSGVLAAAPGGLSAGR